MPAGQHRAFTPLADIATPVWRYMDFTKFVEMLNSRTLYFARADTLGDPFEGTLPRGNVAVDQQMEDLLAEQLGLDRARVRREELVNMRKQMRELVYVNCWHANEVESAAMWRLYAKSDDAIAVRSTYQALSLVLSEDVYLGEVEYIDFDNAAIRPDNILYPFVHKRRSYEHEREVRAVFPPRTLNDFVPPDARVSGIRKQVELHMLVQAVHVAPTTKPWYRELVEALCARYGLNVPVRQSALDAQPIY